MSNYESKRENPRQLRREIRLTYLTILLTMVASVFYTSDSISTALSDLWSGAFWALIQLAIFMGIVLFLIYGNLLYQFTRIGYFHRRVTHSPATREDLTQAVYDRPAPALTILVPSYKEDMRTIEQTLLSAALQQYPKRRVVLLIDDPPHPTIHDDRVKLEAARCLPSEIMAVFHDPAERLQAAFEDFRARQQEGLLTAEQEIPCLVTLYAGVVDWFASQAANYHVRDHVDALFVETTFRTPQRGYLQILDDLRSRLDSGCPTMSERQLFQEYQRLADIFRVEITSFERKRYLNLSHEPNKAANLNSYISLIGKSWRESIIWNGICLEEVEPEQAIYHVPDADYLITLDADSLLIPDYALRLIHVMEQPGNERVAVVQTPYSAIPNAPGVLERIAGATTDIQYIIHQGFTHYRATFWVGANALLRKKALEDIRTVERERGFGIVKYIQDRTVIEDTESTVDLIDKGWQLINYPARLAYSATPPDFGALLIQRRRWANGGLLIAPKLIRYLAGKPWRHRTIGESLSRLHYLISICGVNIGLLLLLLYPTDATMNSWWLPLTAVPYFGLYWRDLILLGYRKADILRVYAFNIMLVPINLAGVYKSLHQACTGRRIPFGRTPKVAGRTSSPVWCLLAEFGLAAYCVFAFGWDAAAGRWTHAVFSLVNALFIGYALIHFLGWRASKEDVLAGLKKRPTHPVNTGGSEKGAGVPVLVASQISTLVSDDPDRQ